MIINLIYNIPTLILKVNKMPDFNTKEIKMELIYNKTVFILIFNCSNMIMNGAILT